MFIGVLFDRHYSLYRAIGLPGGSDINVCICLQCEALV